MGQHVNIESNPGLATRKPQKIGEQITGTSGTEYGTGVAGERKAVTTPCQTCDSSPGTIHVVGGYLVCPPCGWELQRTLTDALSSVWWRGDGFGWGAGG